jgi:hypothetical protein
VVLAPARFWRVHADGGWLSYGAGGVKRRTRAEVTQVFPLGTDAELRLKLRRDRPAEEGLLSLSFYY